MDSAGITLLLRSQDAGRDSQDVLPYSPGTLPLLGYLIPKKKTRPFPVMWLSWLDLKLSPRNPDLHVPRK